MNGYLSEEVQQKMPDSLLSRRRESVKLFKKICVKQIISGYHSKFGIDTAYLFKNIESISMLYDEETGLYFFSPQIFGDAAFYEALSRRSGYHRPDKSEFEIAKKFIKNDSIVLEVGAGLGYFADHITYKKYLGLELNRDAIEAAKILGHDVIARDVCVMADEEPEQYDVTCAFQVLEHVPDPLAMIEAMVKLTRSGGIIILSTPNAGSFISRSRDLLNLPPHHLTWWEDRTWHWVAEKFGILKVEIHHTRMAEMIGPWAQMIASNGVARRKGIELDPVLDESNQRHEIDRIAAPLAQIMCSGVMNEADLPALGHTSVAIFQKN